MQKFGEQFGLFANMYTHEFHIRMYLCLQTFMEQVPIADPLGRATFARARPMHLKNGVTLETANSYFRNRKIYEKFGKLVDQWCGWETDKDKYPHTVFRYPLPVLEFYVSQHVDLRMTTGWNKWYHYKSINTDDILVADNEITHKYGVPQGQRYFICAKPLIVCWTGDGASIPNSPKRIKGGSFVYLHILLFDERGLTHSQYSMVSMVVSGLSPHDPCISQLYAKLSASMGSDGHLSVFRCVGLCICLCSFHSQWSCINVALCVCLSLFVYFYFCLRQNVHCSNSMKHLIAYLNDLRCVLQYPVDVPIVGYVLTG